MNWIELFGEGEDLTPLQMSLRGLVIFIVTLILLRLSGKRSFGMKMPFDQVLLVLIGAVLSRAVVGASPFLATICVSLVLVALHRFIGWISLYSDAFGKLVKGSSTVLYKDGQLFLSHLKQCEVSEKDLMESIRLNSGKYTLDQIKEIRMERNGDISIIPKYNRHIKL